MIWLFVIGLFAVLWFVDSEFTKKYPPPPPITPKSGEPLLRTQWQLRQRQREYEARWQQWLKKQNKDQ